MKASSFRHQSDSRYCFSIDSNRTRIRLAVEKEEKINAIWLVYGDEFRFASTQKRKRMEIRHEDLNFFYYEAEMEAETPRFFYIFHIESEEGEYDLYETGLTQGFNYSLSFLSAFRHNGENAIDFVTPKKKFRGKIVYQIFPDRFAIGSKEKKRSYINRPWNAKGDDLKKNVFLGGDLWGVLEHLDYLASLNVGAIYLTPIHPSKSNHKYDVLNYMDVDASFGGKEALSALVEACHKKGISVIMDLVFNHCSSDHPFFKDVKKKGRASKYYSWFLIDGDKPSILPLNYRCFAYVPMMPKLNTGNKEVQDYLIKVGLYWVKEFHIDAFRLDVSDAVSHYFWTRFKLALREIDPEFLLIGENWLNAESFLHESELDGVMNYPFLAVVGSYLLGQDEAKTTKMRLDGLLMRYKDGNDENMMNILASHDIQRLRNLVKGDIDSCLIGYAIMLFYIGMPMLYYGEELFMEGGQDPDCRRGMDWKKAEHPDDDTRFFAKMLNIRKGSLFAKGKLILGERNGVLSLRREYQKEAMTLYVNATQKEIPVPLKGEIVLARHYENGSLGESGILIVKD